ncbi:AmpD protein [Pseudoalteromonas ulvae UL12]|uniref:1,6-anhydro-N-acetylmuramyl-L-alanine amidase AmpD n=1 Tax=Pseudoalteromonas ulvae TaxID=107327 RepID=UPI00186B6B4F|nr:1,6-anhydro-N-acetylmuramyl-L-alanine amidase AmpD [Pseudoalteromonas ulvae]MBE0363036.1 AmpD protein [Pseudoalteromonas ulvae UL12]
MFAIEQGWLEGVTRCPSTHCNTRPDDEISLLVVHNISLPAGQFGGPFIDDLFLGCLNCTAHPSFADLKGLEVSAHCLIRRDGQVVQYVPFNQRAWHAGVSMFEGRSNCNDFSVGIELEGTDTIPYTDAQYLGLAAIAKSLIKQYPKLTKARITGHEHIAPGRKTDPGQSFDWPHFLSLL